MDSADRLGLSITPGSDSRSDLLGQTCYLGIPIPQAILLLGQNGAGRPRNEHGVVIGANRRECGNAHQGTNATEATAKVMKSTPSGALCAAHASSAITACTRASSISPRRSATSDRIAAHHIDA